MTGPAVPRTVFALATAPGRAAVAVVRIAGPAAFAAAARLGARVKPDRRLRLVRLSDPASGEALDEALAVGFPEGGSFTGTATVELHLHGSTAVIRAVLAALDADPALTPADPGAFTRMAFDTGRLGLAQVEALADLIDAETKAQRRQALAGLDGALQHAAEGWRADLLTARALIEAGLDFADEDIDTTWEAEALATIARVRGSLGAALEGAAAAARVRRGFVVALVGPPNAGKSSLLNALVRREAALVSPLPGTTRDSVEVRADIGGLLVTLVDTAGLRDTTDPLEAMGIDRARRAAREADLRLVVTAPGLAGDAAVPQDGDILVANKADLGAVPPPGAIAVSALTGSGLDALSAAIRDAVMTRVAGASDVSHERQRQALDRAWRALGNVGEAPPELTAEAVREATAALDSLIGRVDIEEVLGAIFGRFCIGK